MQQTAYGTFNKGAITFNEPVEAPDNSDVIVVFLNKNINKLTQNRNELLKIFDKLGEWEDTRDTEDIIAEISASRASKTQALVL